MNASVPCRAAAMLLLATLLPASLAGCSGSGRYYVRPDPSAAGAAGVTGLTHAAVPMSPLDLGVTFKSDGKVAAQAGDTLYQLVRDDLDRRGGWSVRRLGRPGEDFEPVIDAIVAAPAGAGAPQPGVPRMLMLVEDLSDRSGATRRDYFLSGLSVGLYGVRKPVDRYQVTVAYRDPNGLQRIYRSSHELLYGTGKGSRDSDPVPPDLRRYDAALAAFSHIVQDSISGSRRGTVSVGQPQFVPPAP